MRNAKAGFVVDMRVLFIVGSLVITTGASAQEQTAWRGGQQGLVSKGNFRVVAPNPSRYEEVRRVQVSDSETWGVPILLTDGLILRDRDSLVRLRFGS